MSEYPTKQQFLDFVLYLSKQKNVPYRWATVSIFLKNIKDGTEIKQVGLPLAYFYPLTEVTYQLIIEKVMFFKEKTGYKDYEFLFFDNSIWANVYDQTGVVLNKIEPILVDKRFLVLNEGIFR